MPNNFFITTPIYYVNDVPHIGHAYTSIATDFIARFKRMSGVDTIFLTGTDEHGQKIQKAAENNSLEPLSLCDKNSAKFRELTEVLNLSNDDFISYMLLRTKKTILELLEEKKSKNIFNLIKLYIF